MRLSEDIGISGVLEDIFRIHGEFMIFNIMREEILQSTMRIM